MPNDLQQEFYRVDSHMHLHPGFDLDRVLSAAARNMDLSADASGEGMLMLTEIAGIDRFADLPERCGNWVLSDTKEPISKLARRAGDGAVIGIVSGRQILTDEGLEVLALGTRATFADGQPLATVIDAASAAGALVVLPWGFGKWSGARAAVMDEVIAGHVDDTNLFLADSGVRSSAMARPDKLLQAERVGWRILAGTDPLPLMGGVRQSGRYGFAATGALHRDYPFVTLATWLRGLQYSPPVYGRLTAPFPFVVQQVVMQIRKRLG
ncbi:hypothetical protein [Actibacterium sp. 188UL27-1]|uniref:hypothetical protein n=1 Tax=Actibacterium sp. 188UL27-1 TaxID=2786961 RepID=UPI001957B4E5|nr:hypothetical protein [Actibacterium sp. 188UL27-1]MBM7069084.1 hypothetical protein [Actibacterium sp. 188UL27-1]